jgi:adenylate kinase
MKKGELVDFSIAAAIFTERVNRPDCKNGYIIDGYGRDLSQFAFFDPHPNWVIHIRIPEAETIRRISGRRYCTGDGLMYNINTLPKEELVACKGNLIQRPDDTPEAIKVRLDIYHKETVPVVEKFKQQGILLDIDGMGTPEQVYERILEALAKAQQSRL